MAHVYMIYLFKMMITIVMLVYQSVYHDTHSNYVNFCPILDPKKKHEC